MEFFVLEPEVAGGLGPKTVLDRSTHPPVVKELHYVFDGWLGDELLETFPCFIVTEHLWQLVEKEALTGVSSGPVRVGVSEMFEEMYPGRVLPRFVRLLPTGNPGTNDFGVAKDARLVVSKKALDVIRRRKLEHCSASVFSG